MISYGRDYTDERGEPLPELVDVAAVTTAERPGDDLLAGMLDGRDLDALTLSPLRYAVAGLVPEGLTILAGPPKLGKSWAVLDLALAVASGGRALGAVEVEQGDVLYLALEDGHRRLQDRCRHLLGRGEPIPPRLHVLTRLAEPRRLLDTLRAFLQAHPRTRLVVIDTLARARPPAPANVQQYDHEYRVVASLKQLADEYGVALLVVHHTRKLAAGDFLAEVSGTHGLTGAADTVLSLGRARGDADGVLRVTGRDVPEAEYAMRMTGGAWQLLDQPPSDPNIGDRSARILAHVADRPGGVRAEDVAAALDLPRDTAKRYLSRLADAGRLVRRERGLYAPVPSVPSVPFVTLNGTDGTQGTHLLPLSEDEWEGP